MKGLFGVGMGGAPSKEEEGVGAYTPLEQEAIR